MPNEKLKWQQTDTWNIGLEMGLLNGRITARAEYFQKLTKNSLTQVTLAPSLGFGSYPENMGTLENKGVELNFAFIPYQNTAKISLLDDFSQRLSQYGQVEGRSPRHCVI